MPLALRLWESRKREYWLDVSFPKLASWNRKADLQRHRSKGDYLPAPHDIAGLHPPLEQPPRSLTLLQRPPGQPAIQPDKTQHNQRRERMRIFAVQQHRSGRSDHDDGCEQAAGESRQRDRRQHRRNPFQRAGDIVEPGRIAPGHIFLDLLGRREDVQEAAQQEEGRQ